LDLLLPAELIRPYGFYVFAFRVAEDLCPGIDQLADITRTLMIARYQYDQSYRDVRYLNAITEQKKTIPIASKGPLKWR
jgi:hypothetical protein